MGPYGIGDLGLNGPKVDIWDQDGRIWGSGINGVLWDVGFGVGWPKGGDMGSGMRMGMDGALWDVGFGVGWPLKWRYGAQG